jgi:hypothetical protein
MSNKKLNKRELIEILVNDYGYDKADLKDADGKPFTNAKLEAMIKQEEADAVEIEAKETVFVAKQTFKDDDLIMVMNGLNGGLTHNSHSTGRIWKFTRFGQTEKIPYSELLSIRNQNPKVFEQGWMVILNKQIQEDFGLVEVYKHILTPETIDGIFTKGVDEIEQYVKALPEGMKVTFIGKARELYVEKKLDSKRVIDFIESYFGISLEDNAPLADII